MSEGYIGDPIKRQMREQLKTNIVNAARKDSSLSFVDLGERFGCGRSTVRRVIKEQAPDVYERLRGRPDLCKRVRRHKP